MKTFFYLFLLVFFCSTLHAQDCSTYAFPYLFAKNVNGVCTEEWLCSQHPGADTPPGFTVVRWQPGSLIEYSVSNVSQNCVDPDKLSKCINDAFCAWLKLCPSYDYGAAQSDPDPTNKNIIQITNSSDATQFGTDNLSVQGAIAVTNLAVWCDGRLAPFTTHHIANILINTNAARTKVATDIYPCPSLKPSCNLAVVSNPVDLCSALTHEVGHLLGLQHTKASAEDEANGIPDCGNSSPQDIMYPQYGAQTHLCDGHKPSWTQYDCCNFKKLYCDGDNSVPCPTGESACWDNLGVESNVIPAFDPQLQTYPNPTTGILNIQFISDKVGTVMLGIFDMLGHQLMTEGYLVQGGKEIHTVDLSKLPAEHYIVRIIGANLRGSRLIEMKRK